MTDKPIPHAPDSERALLGILLLDPARIEEARRAFKPSQFFLDSNRLIYQAILNLSECSIAIDPMQVVEELRAHNLLEKAGGPSAIAALTDYSIRSDYQAHVDRISDAALKRKIWIAASRAAEAVNNGQASAEVIAALNLTLEEINAGQAQAGKSKPRLALSWAEFEAEEYSQGERIGWAVERGEIALLNALPNAGKTTLALNSALALAIGRSFPPIIENSTPRRVLYVDGETRRTRLQRDIRTMSRGFNRDEAITLGQNLFTICEAEIKGESLALTHTNHLLQLSEIAIDIRPDFVVIDTMATLCPVISENDNAEQSRKVWRPLQKLARDCDAALLVLHHVGKRNEDGVAPELVYRGRGASASGGAARAIWLLTPDAIPGMGMLRCVKAKGETPANTRLQLDQQTRWMSAVLIANPKPITPIERVLEVVSRKLRTGEIKALINDFSDRAVEGALSEALQLKKIRYIKKGVYGPLEDQSAASAPSAKPANADDADDADEGDFTPKSAASAPSALTIGGALGADASNSFNDRHLEEKSQKRKKTSVRMRGNGNPHPHQAHPPIVSADGADASNSNNHNDLEGKHQDFQKMPVRMIADERELLEI